MCQIILYIDYIYLLSILFVCTRTFVLTDGWGEGKGKGVLPATDHPKQFLSDSTGTLVGRRGSKHIFIEGRHTHFEKSEIGGVQLIRMREYITVSYILRSIHN